MPTVTGSTTSSALRIYARVARTRVEGPHLRSVVWVSGCTIRCPGCCNPEMFDAGAGTRLPVSAIAEGWPADIEGITVLGGEPLEQVAGVAALAAAAQQRGLGVVVATGFTAAQARARPGFAALWRHVDTLLAGPFDRRRPEPEGARKLVGSSNQRLLHRTPRYRDPRLWTGPRAAEVAVDADGGVTVLGAPKLVAAVRRRLHA